MTRIALAQIGRRRHFAELRHFHESGCLELFHTDFWMSDRHAIARLPVLPAGLRKRAGGRSAAGIPAGKVRAHNLFGLQYWYRLYRSRTQSEQLHAYNWAAEAFPRHVLRGGGCDNANAIYAYNNAAEGLFAAYSSSSIRKILDQTIAPKRTEIELLERERQKFPAWADAPFDCAAANAIAERESREWALASVIVCGSEFVRQSIADLGGPVERCIVVPSGIAAPPACADAARKTDSAGRRDEPLKVLFAGAVNLRKGAPYVLEIARRLGTRIEIRMVGPIAVTGAPIADLADRVTLTGAVPHAAMEGHFRWADVLFLPSVCEGSAMVTYEALAAGVPVVCTPNAGAVVKTGVTGFVAAAGDTDAMEAYLAELADDRDLLKRMAAQAAKQGRLFTESRYGEALLAAAAGEKPVDRIAASGETVH